MEQLKVQIDQMIYQLKQRSLGQSTVDMFEMIGKLEQAKSYLLAEAMRTFDPLPSGRTFNPLPSGRTFNPLSSGRTFDPLPSGRTFDPLPSGFFDGLPTNFQHAGPRHQQAAQVGNDSRWKYLWDLSDEYHFVPVTHLPIPWFTTRVYKAEDHQFLVIVGGPFAALCADSPSESFINSPMFCSIGMPVTLTSSMLVGPSNVTTCPGLLISVMQGVGLHLYWPSLGQKFVCDTIIQVSYQWKMFGWKYKLFVTINEEG